jgi:sec-independent protein translocase protein TatC
MNSHESAQMSFLDHLEELRWRLIKSITAILIGGIVSFLFIEDILQFLIFPIKNLSNPPDLQVLKVQGMFMIKWGVALLGGVVLAVPVLTYQLAKFIGPGLHNNEKKVMFPLVFFSYFAFLIGIVFILSSIGILTPAFMRHYRRHALVFILILSAFITPPDPISLVFMSIPLAILYEISIGVSWMVKRNK